MIRIAYYLFLSVLSLLVLPLGVLLSILITLESGFPILFTQKRMGKGDRAFTLYKFRTMRIGADQEQEKLRSKNEADGPVFKIKNDPRFTRIGKFLSHIGLDELPQFINIWKGDMAIVGPRPLPVSEARNLSATQQERHSVKPGIISPWVLDGYHKKPFVQWMKSDVAYAKRKNIPEDIVLFLRACVLPLRLLWGELSS